MMSEEPWSHGGMNHRASDGYMACEAMVGGGEVGCVSMDIVVLYPISFSEYPGQ